MTTTQHHYLPNRQIIRDIKIELSLINIDGKKTQLNLQMLLERQDNFEGKTTTRVLEGLTNCVGK